MKELNQTLLKSFKTTSNEALLVLAKWYKNKKDANSSRNFQINYDTILHEIKERGLK